MVGLFRAGFSFSKNLLFTNSVRTLSTTRPLNLKEIREQKDGNNLVIEGVQVSSPRTELLVRNQNVSSEKELCYMCALNLDVKHTDVLILSQFVRSDGCMLPRRITGLCKRQQKKIGTMVTMAQKAGLMINLTPNNCKKDPKLRFGYKKYNTYFDEATIFWKRIPKPVDRFKR
ncbi:28S ribosomal protein S18a, mitochondrial [Eumeta japonica]|uniref:Large ribosomal subunit protein mL66 n=1 Tax=Eumeta variegata TaxID=151549 RepID=A0A4C1ZUG0_EUMVA|nr:28S ribosomal protein S18a, mitochondrial [Eumeta japonica]